MNCRMPLILTAVCLAALAGSLGIAHAKDISTADQNKKLITEFYEMTFVKHRPKDAANKFIGDTYIQHNPHVPNGREAFIGFFEGMFKKNPTASSVIARIVAEGDLVVVHSNAKQNQADRGQAIMDIYRFENGKMVEHWDVMQPVPDKTASGNTMF